VKAIGGDTPENLKLTALRKLHGHALMKVNAVALAQDRRGYHVSPGVYGHTPKAVLRHHHSRSHDSDR
jgi:hypothetical protein